MGSLGFGFGLSVGNLLASVRDPGVAWDKGIWRQSVADAYAGLYDIVGLGDSNQVYGGNGWDYGNNYAIVQRSSLYGTGLFSANENDGLGSGIGYKAAHVNAGLVRGAVTGAPSPFDDIWTAFTVLKYLWLSSGSIAGSVNNEVALDADHPLVNEALSFCCHYAKFSADGGYFIPRIRLTGSPYTTFGGGATIACTGDTDVMARAVVTCAAAARNASINGRISQGAEITNSKFFFTFSHMWKTGASTGGAASTLYYGGGKTARDCAIAIQSMSDGQLAHYFDCLRQRQIDCGKSPRVIVRVCFGLNDRNDTNDSVGPSPSRSDLGPGFVDNHVAIRAKIEAVWASQGWSSDELLWQITPSHRVADPDDADLLSFRSALKTWVKTIPRAAMVDFGACMTSSEAVDGGWYDTGPDVNHLVVPGQEALSLREYDAVVSQS